MQGRLGEYSTTMKEHQDKKSTFVFSHNAKNSQAYELLQQLGGIQRVHQGKYLGQQLVIGRSKNQVWGYIKGNCTNGKGKC